MRSSWAAMRDRQYNAKITATAMPISETSLMNIQKPKKAPMGLTVDSIFIRVLQHDRKPTTAQLRLHLFSTHHPALKNC